MSTAVNEKVVDTLVAYFQNYTNPSQSPAAFSEFEKQLKDKMNEKGLTNLDDSNESKEIAQWIQAEMPKYGGSVQSPMPVETILQWDNKVYEQVKDEPVTPEGEKKPDGGKPAEGDKKPDPAKPESLPSDITDQINKPVPDGTPPETQTFRRPQDAEPLADITKPVPEGDQPKNDPDNVWDTPPDNGGALGRLFGYSPKRNSPDIDGGKGGKPETTEVKLPTGAASGLPKAEQSFIDEMKKVERTSEWKGGDMAGGGTRENIGEFKVWFRDKTTGKPAEGSPKSFTKGNLDLENLKALLKGNDNMEVYGAEVIWKDGAKAWSSTASASKEDFARFLDYGDQGAKWINYEPQLTVSDKEKEKSPDLKPAKEYNNDRMTQFNSVIDLGGGRYAWSDKEGQRYWGDFKDFDDSDNVQRLKFALSLKDDAGNPLIAKDKWGDALGLDVLVDRTWKNDFFETAGKDALDYSSISLHSVEIDGEKREFYLVKGFDNHETGLNETGSFLVEKDAKSDNFYDRSHLLGSMMKMKPENYDKMSDEDKKKTSFGQLIEHAKNGGDYLLYRTVGDNDASYGSMHKDAFKGDGEIEKLSGSFENGDAVWKVKIKGHTFIVSQELVPNNIDKFSVDLNNGGKKEVGGDMPKEESWKYLTQYLAEHDTTEGDDQPK